MALYDLKRWKVLRAHQLQSHPLCAFCQAQGIISAASVADHVIPHRNDPALFFNAGNLQSLCKRCHDAHKQRLEKSGRVIGASLTGEPINPHTRWHE
jgi:5-methylcytosine-specific restriction endonuclease McrA